MAGKGVRRVLEPALYIGVALSFHALLFLIPSGSGSKRGEATVRGMRIRTVGEARESPSHPFSPRPVSADRLGGTPSGATGTGAGSPSPGVSGGGGDGGGAASDGVEVGAQGSPPIGEYGEYLARLRSEGVQGWARDSAGRMRQGWKGSGKGGKGLWIGSGGGDGRGGGGGGMGGGYLDPRVRMVVTSYPPTSIEHRHTQVTYPDLKVKKTQYTSGWWNVYIQIRTDGGGNVIRTDLLRPETDGPLEKIFVAQVRREIARWSFDRTAAEINVDVRFYVE
ncbi:MAG: hypothetical protein ACYC47_02510 [Desulfobacteria bacterium]|nr:hypothetical protein [Deltaproteobacteria bacterium]HQT96569.1 hypothetical protein [Thermodesulfobacteriota bacterium]